jgi:hypothetical protein
MKAFSLFKHSTAILFCEHDLHIYPITQRAILNFTPGGQIRPWGSKYAPRGEVKNGPQDKKMLTVEIKVPNLKIPCAYVPRLC